MNVVVGVLAASDELFVYARIATSNTCRKAEQALGRRIDHADRGPQCLTVITSLRSPY